MLQTDIDKRELLDAIFDICEDNGGSVFFNPIIIFDDNIPGSYTEINEVEIDGWDMHCLLDCDYVINLEKLSVDSINDIYNAINEYKKFPN